MKNYVATFTRLPATAHSKCFCWFPQIWAAADRSWRQEFMILPVGASSFCEAMCIGAEVIRESDGKNAGCRNV